MWMLSLLAASVAVALVVGVLWHCAVRIKMWVFQNERPHIDRATHEMWDL